MRARVLQYDGEERRSREATRGGRGRDKRGQPVGRPVGRPIGREERKVCVYVCARGPMIRVYHSRGV